MKMQIMKIVHGVLVTGSLFWAVGVACAAPVPEPSASATTVTLDGDFVQFDKSAKTVDVTVGGVTKHAIFQERYPIKKDHLESILASLKTGDKAQFVGYTKPDGTTVITAIIRPPSTNAVTSVAPVK